MIYWVSSNLQAIAKTTFFKIFEKITYFEGSGRTTLVSG